MTVTTMLLSPESGTNAIRWVDEPRNFRVKHGIDDGAGHALRVDIGSERLHHLSTQALRSLPRTSARGTPTLMRL
jgi:hypothetical protein